MLLKNQNKKRFLFLITHYYPVIYGAELFAKKLAEYLVSQGHEVDIITGKWESKWSITQKVNGVNIWRVPVIKVRGIQTIAFLGPQWWYAKHQLESYQYDFIHAHIFPSLVTGALLQSDARKILTIQGGDLADYPEIYGPSTPFIKHVISKSLKQYDLIHTVSTDLYTKVKELSGNETLTIPNGVDRSLLSIKPDIHLKKKYFPKTRYVAFSPSRLTNKNNLLETIKAIQLCQKKNRDLGLVIAGEGHLRSTLDSYIRTHNLEASIKLIGSVDHEVSVSLSSLADVVVRVSKQEGFGIALLEGLAVGTPVVSSREGGLKDFISEDVAYVSKTIASEIAKALSSALEKESKKRSHNALQLVEKSYTWETILPNFVESVYQLS